MSLWLISKESDKSAESVDYNSAMELKAAVEKYLGIAGRFGRPMPLSSFAVSRQELEGTLSAWDEDYHLHRHFELIAAPPASPGNSADFTAYLVNGIAYSSIVFKETIGHVLP